MSDEATGIHTALAKVEELNGGTESHTLTYQGIVDPQIGSILGQGIDGRRWQVAGSVYDTVRKVTEVTVEFPPDDELA